MIPARYRWERRQPDEALAAAWSRRLGLPLLAAKVLVARGWTEEEAAQALRPADADPWEDPLRMKDMAAAAERIRRAVERRERIRVYGDYDADGVTSTALMARLLTQLGASFDTYIPHRSLEGYGLNLPAIDAAATAGVTLIVTVDNGISAVEPIAYAREKAIDVVVTDHHEPPAVLPDAYALVNPKQADCPYPFKGLCGAGVAFKLAHALLGRPATEYADLAAIGTVADLMPLLGENRRIVRLGLERMRRTPLAGIRALAAVSGTEPAELSSGRIGFGLAPRLNAGGRLERADGALRLLTTDDPDEAAALARDLDQLNAQRQKLVDATLMEAERMWREKLDAGVDPNVIVLAGVGWNAGIAGLVASKMVERYYRPTIILASDPETGKCKGSARSIEGFDIHAALTECAALLEHFGGHQAAAGMTLAVSRVGELEARLHELAGLWLTPADWMPRKRVDLSCSLEETTLAAADALARLEPFGNANPSPRFLLEGVRVLESRTMGKDNKHLRLTVEQAGRTLECVGFGMGELAGRLATGRGLDLLGELTVNEWNGNRKPQLMLQDLRSDEPIWVDRRAAADVWRELDRLAAEGAEGLYAIGASSQTLGEAAVRPSLQGVVIAGFAEIQALDGSPAGREIAAARERGSGQAAAAEGAPPRRLAVLGLPDNEVDVGHFAAWLRAGAWDRVILYPSRSPRQRQPALERAHFAQVYALFRKQAAWIDGPEGFLRRAAEQTGLPLAAVRLIQEVFEELGFVRASGAERAFVAQPKPRGLEESARFQRMQRQAETESFPDWPLDRLRAWALVRMREESV